MPKNISPRKSANTEKLRKKPHEKQQPKIFALNILPDPIQIYAEFSRISQTKDFTNQRSRIPAPIQTKQNRQTKYHKPETPPLNPTVLTDIESYQTKKYQKKDQERTSRPIANACSFTAIVF